MLLRILGVVIIIIPFPPNWGGDDRADAPEPAPVVSTGNTEELEPPAVTHFFSTSELGGTEDLDHLRA